MPLTRTLRIRTFTTFEQLLPTPDLSTCFDTDQISRKNVIKTVGNRSASVFGILYKKATFRSADGTPGAYCWSAAALLEEGTQRS